MHFLRNLALVFLSALLLAACGSNSTAQVSTEVPKPTEAPQPTVKPTTAPEPTEKPTVAPEPTEKPTAIVKPTSTPIQISDEPTAASSDAPVTQAIEFGDLKSFDHPKGVFTIKYPENWKVQDSSTDSEATVIFTDPTSNGVVIARVVEEAQEQDDIALENAMRTYLKTILKDSKNLKVDDGVKQSDGSIRVDFVYDEEVDGKTVPFQGGGFVEKHGQLLSFLLDGAPVEQWDAVTKNYNEIINSYKVDESASLSSSATGGDKLADVEIGDLQTYTHPSGAFSIDAPVNWGEPQDKTSSGEVLVVFSDPNQNAQIVADIFGKPSGDLSQFLADFIKKSYKDEPNFSMDDPQTQTDGSVRVSFQYDVTVQGVTATMLGNSFIEDHDDKASAISFVVPQDQFKALQPKIDDIVNSFKVNSSAKIQ